MSESSGHDPLCPLGKRDTTHQSWGFVECRCDEYTKVRADERARASDEVEEFRLGLPLATKASQRGWRSRDDMSWALAMVRDRIKKEKP